MSTEISQHFGPIRDEERNAAADILSQAFGLPLEDSLFRMRRAADTGGQQYLLKEDGQVAATVAMVPMGQWFGGRRVPTVGIAAVGVAPERRGRGTATRLMQEAMRVAHAQGAPLSTLYPSTQPLYQRVGFEQAGGYFEIRVPVANLALGERALSLRPIQDSDQEAIRACYTRHAERQQGWLDRTRYMWTRAVQPIGETAYGYLVEGSEGVEGYLYLVRRKHANAIALDIALTDFVALTPRAGRRLLSFLGDHRSVAHDVTWRGGPQDALLMLLPEQTFEVKHLYHWMVRVLDVGAALEARGYPVGLSGALHLEVSDDLFPENHGRFVLEVDAGGARVRRGGDGRLRLDVRALAPLYTGLYPPAALHAVGRIEGDEASLRLASALFSGPMPAMPELF
ncbi:GNAT family N-acetyltransferase [Myxococcaceae bacterium GXIMD 01537]